MITRRQFVRTHWNQYLICEGDFIRLLEYVDLRGANKGTCSNRIIVQLVTVCSLIDSTLREMFDLSLSSGLNSMSKQLMAEGSFSHTTEVTVLLSLEEGMKVAPWSSLGLRGKKAIPDWWSAYNNLKHNRFQHYHEGTLRNLLNALSGLYIVEMLYAKKVGDYWYGKNGKRTSDETRDVPNDVSRAFEIEGWRTRDHVIGYEAYLMNSDDLSGVLGEF